MKYNFFSTFTHNNRGRDHTETKFHIHVKSTEIPVICCEGGIQKLEFNSFVIIFSDFKKRPVTFFFVKNELKRKEQDYT